MKFKMYGFTQIPSSLVLRAATELSRPTDMRTLKSLIGVFNTKGLYEESIKSPSEIFPASLSDILRMSSLGRNNTVAAVNRLIELNYISTTSTTASRTRSFMLTGKPIPFTPFPYANVIESDLLCSLREGTASNMAVLRVYLILCWARNNKYGTSKVSYNTLESHFGIKRANIKPAITALAVSELISAGPNDGDSLCNIYSIKGLGYSPNRLSDDRWRSTRSEAPSTD